MTYILQYQHQGINAIISDIRVTMEFVKNQSIGYNSYLKTGHLYPGFMYGIIGNTRYASEFIQSANAYVANDENLEIKWEKFLNIVTGYSFPTGVKNSFTILFSIISKNCPLFFVLESNSGGIDFAQKEGNNIVATYGSGKPLLDDFVFNILNKKTFAIQKYLETQEGFSKQLIHKISPYIICQQLSEMVLTSERMIIENAKVGGPFYFIYQTIDSQKYQAPSVYIMSFPNKKKRTVHSEFYRIAFPNNMMYIEKNSSLQTGHDGYDLGIGENFIVNTTSNPNLIGLELDEIVEIGRQGLIGMDYWSYLGFGRANSENREHFAFKLKKGGELTDIIDTKGNLREEIRTIIDKGFN